MIRFMTMLCVSTIIECVSVMFYSGYWDSWLRSVTQQGKPPEGDTEQDGGRGEVSREDGIWDIFVFFVAVLMFGLIDWQKQ